jgi:hypothetical protein
MCYELYESFIQKTQDKQVNTPGKDKAAPTIKPVQPHREERVAETRQDEREAEVATA